MTYAAYVSRINQLDAIQLDHEIDRIILSRINDISQYFVPKFTYNFTPELNALVRTAIGVFSLGKRSSTFGQKLLDLTYVNLTKTKTALFIVLTVVPKYLADKYLDDNRLIEQRTFKEYLEKVSNLLKILNLINILIFLNRGKHPTIVENILDISTQNVVAHKARTIGYSYMTRELLWHGLLELFTKGIPAINFHYLKQLFLKSRISKTDQIQSLEKPVFKSDTICPYCKENPVLPCYAGCQHIYCYYCLQAHFTAAANFNCLACGTKLNYCDMKNYIV